MNPPPPNPLIMHYINPPPPARPCPHQILHRKPPPPREWKMGKPGNGKWTWKIPPPNIRLLLPLLVTRGSQRENLEILCSCLCAALLLERQGSRGHTGRKVGKWKIICACVVEKHGKNHRLEITHRLQFSEVCYGAICDHLQLWCHVSHYISFECVFECVPFFLKNTH